MTALQSMTGFGRGASENTDYRVSAEIRSVNGKNLDIRFRLPNGLESVELAGKKRIANLFQRGNLQVSISIDGVSDKATTAIDAEAFISLAKQASDLATKAGIAPPTADGILAIRGVVESGEGLGWEGDEETRNAVETLVSQAIEEAAKQLLEMRETEGKAISALLTQHLETILQLTADARADEANAPETVLQRLKLQMDKLMSVNGDGALELDRLHAEAALLASKCDVTEEVDRLDAHVAAAQNLLKEGGAIGRKLDFISQEFNRETNTICSKSASATLTATGLALKAVIDQFREQVQNLQ